MSKKLLTLSVAILVAGSSVYAFGPMNQRSFCGNKMAHKVFRGNKGIVFDIMSIVSDMNLSNEQWIEVKKIMLEVKEQRLKHLKNKKVFTIYVDENGIFDKDKFIQERTTYSKKMIELQADIIEKILSVLNDSQKKILIKKLTLKEILK
jgi:hypothetical protein